MANLGGVWRAVLAGFAGVSVLAGVLTGDPCLPSTWSSLEVRFRCLGRRVRLAINCDEVTVGTDGPLPARRAGGSVQSVRGSVHLGKPPQVAVS
jgi:trehalose/maltose hydrolase-like predicted phosphorylase